MHQALGKSSIMRVSCLFVILFSEKFAGIGTMSDKEVRECFRKIERHRITLKYRGKEDDKSIMLAFCKKKVGREKGMVEGVDGGKAKDG